MYIKICKKLKLYKKIVLVFNIMIFAGALFFIIALVHQIFFLKKNIHEDKNYNKNIVLDFMKKPILQINNDENIIYITSDGAEIKDEENIVMTNVNIESKNIKGFSKKIIIKDDELILDNRPHIILYNITD
jgi:hypothetical protein